MYSSHFFVLYNIELAAFLEFSHSFPRVFLGFPRTFYHFLPPFPPPKTRWRSRAADAVAARSSGRKAKSRRPRSVETVGFLVSVFIRKLLLLFFKGCFF